MSNINTVHVGPGGSFEPSGDYSTTPSDIDKLGEHWAANDTQTITLHFHGGLVSEESGVKTAKMMKTVFEAANNYPLSFVWETGLIETFRDNLTRIHRTKLFKKLLKWAIKRTAERFGGFNARGAGTPIPIDEIEAQLTEERPFESYDQPKTGRGAARGGNIAVTETDLDGIREELEAEFEEDIESDSEIEALLEEEDRTKPEASQRGIFSSAKLAARLGKVAYRVIKRHVRGRDHGFYPTIVEEILREFYLADLGAWVWGQMKEKSKAMWAPNDGLIGDDQHVGSYLLDAIDRHYTAHGDVKINLVGHSAGSIAICHLLATVSDRYPNLSFNHIVFLAPAARSDFAVAELANHQDRYKNFRIYTMADTFEQSDVLVPYVYTRSLLYFISGVLEPDTVDQPLSGMMRHASRQAPFDSGPARAWADFIFADDRAVLSDTSVLSPDAEIGRRSTSVSHGDFDNDPETQGSLKHLLKP